jgi:hypothetical protein
MGKNFLKENQKVMVKGTNIQPKSKITAGAIIKRAADRDALVDISISSGNRTVPYHAKLRIYLNGLYR